MSRSTAKALMVGAANLQSLETGINIVKTHLLGLTILGAVLLLITGGQARTDEKDKGPGVGALPPHALDSAFAKARTGQQIDEALLNHPLFQKAVKEALKAKQDRENEMKKNPKILAATPAEAARKRFLEILLDEKGDGAEKK
jgi:hypothetical protein